MAAATPWTSPEVITRKSRERPRACKGPESGLEQHPGAFVSADTLGRLDVWLADAGITAGPLFVPLGNARQASRLGEADIARIFRRRAAAAGIAPEAIGGHSTRVGAAQDMVAHNLGMAAIQQAGGWKSPRMPARYGEQLEAKRSGAAILAGIQGR